MDRPAGFEVSRLAMEIATALATAAFGAIVAYGALDFGTGWDETGPQPGFFPLYLGLITVAASFCVLVQAVIRRERRGEVFATGAQLRRVAAFLLPIAAFVAVSLTLGLYVGMFLYLAGVMLAQGGYRPPLALAVALGVTAVSYLVFETWFQVPLLKGPIEAWLGL